MTYQTAPSLPCPFNADASVKGVQRQRRDAIFATARRMIAEGGNSALSVRALSSECQTSPQTLHNNIGSKGDIICSALIDYHDRMFRHIAGAARESDLYVGFMEANRGLVEEYPEYVASTLGLLYSDPSLYDRMMSRTAFHVAPFVRLMLGASHVTDEHRKISYQLVSVANSAVREWTQGLCSIDEMVEKALFGGDLILSGAILKHQAEKELASRKATERLERKVAAFN